MANINFQGQFNPDKEKSIAELANKFGVKIKLPCDGKGKCGKCLFQIIEGEVAPPTKEEEKHIKSSDLAKGFRLACCAIPTSDLSIRLEIKEKK